MRYRTLEIGEEIKGCEIKWKKSYDNNPGSWVRQEDDERLLVTNNVNIKVDVPPIHSEMSDEQISSHIKAAFNTHAKQGKPVAYVQEKGTNGCGECKRWDVQFMESFNNKKLCHDCHKGMTRLERVLAGYEKDPYTNSHSYSSVGGEEFTYKKEVSRARGKNYVFLAPSEAPPEQCSRLTWAEDLTKAPKTVGWSDFSGEEFE